MALLASSTVPEVEQKLDNNVPHAIKLVMAMSSASPELTVGEHNKRLMISRSTLWILAVFRPSAFILFSAGTIYATRGWDYQWCLPVVLLSFIYQAAVMFVLGHLALFVPRTPFSVCEALDEVGFKEIGLGVLVSTAIVLDLRQSFHRTVVLGLEHWGLRPFQSERRRLPLLPPASLRPPPSPAPLSPSPPCRSSCSLTCLPAAAVQRRSRLGSNMEEPAEQRFC